MRLADPPVDRFGYGRKGSIALLRCTINGIADTLKRFRS